ncbi:hypothetical protein INR49_015460 [Caranx melampygus]|nr:hypothetical protein INR49_015460 [Caranx melampygus]
MVLLMSHALIDPAIYAFRSPELTQTFRKMLLCSNCVDERVDHRVAHDEDEDQVEEEGSPADDEDPQQDGERDGALHARSLVNGVVAGQGGDALDVRAGQHEHVAVEGRHDEQHGKEHGDQADDDWGGVRVDDEDNAAARAEAMASRLHIDATTEMQIMESKTLSI